MYEIAVYGMANITKNSFSGDEYGLRVNAAQVANYGISGFGP